ncbi:MAG: DoxX family protein [Burkholderiaceae bacterium]
MKPNKDEVSSPRTPLARTACAVAWTIQMFERLPISPIAFLARFSIAAVFWKSGQTKIDGLSIDLIAGQFHLGVPHLTRQAIMLFRDEFALPLIPPNLAAHLAASAEHVFPVMILLGLATRFSALALLGMTFVIEIFVYPDAYPTHGVWAAVLLYLIARGPGMFSFDHWIRSNYLGRWGALLKSKE